MNIKKEIGDLKGDIERIDCEMEEVGILLNSHGELSKVLKALISLDHRLKRVEKKLDRPDYKINLWRKK